jgi:hypothetical protein
LFSPVLTASAALTYTFDDGTFQGWTELTVANTNAGPRNFTASHSAPSGLFLRGGTHDGASAVEQVIAVHEDNPHPTLHLRSPEFTLDGSGDLTVWLMGGPGAGSLDGVAGFGLPASSTSPGFQGIALRDASTGTYVLSARKSGEGNWQQVRLTAAQLATLNQFVAYTLDLIDQGHGGWGWVSMDTVSVPGVPGAPESPFITFIATPAQIMAGESSTLNWNVVGATNVTIDQGIGVVATNGSRSVSPAVTTTYTLTANGSTGTRSRAVTVVVPAGRLNGKTYDTSEGDSLLDPISNLLAITPSALFDQIADISFDHNFLGTLPGLTSSDSFAVLWEGWFDVTKDGYGDYTFGTSSDDGSVIHLDLNNDGDFDDAGELIVDNNGSHPTQIRTGTVNLQMDAVRFALGYYDGNGEEVLYAKFKKGSGLAFSLLDPINGITGHFQPAAPPGGMPAITFSASPTAIQTGRAATLTWSVNNATNVSIDQGIGLVPTNGSRSVSPTATTTYTLTATGPAGTRTRTATVTLVPAGAFRYFRLVPTALRNPTSANSVQLAEFQMLLGGVRIGGATASNPGGDSPGGETPAEGNDNNLDTKWLDYNKGALVLDFGTSVAADRYRWATANDATERDPVSWRVEGSHDGSNWIALDTQTNYATPTDRKAYTGQFTLSSPPATFRITRICASPAGATLTWESQPSALYTIEATANAANPSSWSVIERNISSSGTTTTKAVTAGNAAWKFFRVKSQAGYIQPHPAFKVTHMSVSPSGATLTWESQPSALYTIEATANPANPNSWSVVEQNIASGGATATKSVPIASANWRFFRVKSQL